MKPSTAYMIDVMTAFRTEEHWKHTLAQTLDISQGNAKQKGGWQQSLCLVPNWRGALSEMKTSSPVSRSQKTACTQPPSSHPWPSPPRFLIHPATFSHASLTHCLVCSCLSLNHPPSHAQPDPVPNCASVVFLGSRGLGSPVWWLSNFPRLSRGFLNSCHQASFCFGSATGSLSPSKQGDPLALKSGWDGGG